MEQNYTIDEILLAVNEIKNKKKDVKDKILKNQSLKKNYSEVPKRTLQIIEEAEKTK